MSDLDLSFVQIDSGGKGKAKQSDVLNLDFLKPEPEPPKVTPLKVEPAKPEPVVASEPEEDRGFLQTVGDFFTGNDRETDAIADLPEFDVPSIFALTRPLETAKTALGLMTTFDPKQQVQVLKANFPKLKFAQDEKGNIIVDGTEEGAGIGVLNIPGVSIRDLTQMGFQIAAFNPAAKAASAAGSILGNSAKVAAASAGTQAGIDLAGQASGRTDDVSLGNISGADAALAAAGGGLVQGLFQGLSKFIPALRQKIAQSGITDEVRNSVRETAIKLGFNADDVTDDVIRQVTAQADDAVNPQSFALQGEREFRVPLTAAQRTMDDAALSFEDAARAGSRGEKAQRIMRGFETEKQIPAINRAANEVTERVVGGPVSASSRADRGALVVEQVQGAERTAKAAVDAAYDAVGDASLKPGGFQKLIESTKKAIDDIEFINEPALTPATDTVLRRLSAASETIGRTVSGGAEMLTPAHINRIEAVRKSLGALHKAAANPTDGANILQMQRRFDDFMDDAVKNALFSGDDTALAALKNARSTFRDYAQKFRVRKSKTKSGRNIPDPQGDFIEKMISSNPTGEQVVNAVFGASGFTKQGGANMAIRFRDILGAESEGWRAIKQEAVSRLIKTNTVNGSPIVSGQKSLAAINDAIEKNGSLMRELFSKDDLGVLRRFALHVKRTQPDLVRSRENPSGTGQAVTKTLADLARRVGNIFAMGGDPALMATTRGVEVARGFTAGSRASKSVRPFERFIANPDAVAIGIGSGQMATQ